MNIINGKVEYTPLDNMNSTELSKLTVREIKKIKKLEGEKKMSRGFNLDGTPRKKYEWKNPNKNKARFNAYNNKEEIFDEKYSINNIREDVTMELNKFESEDINMNNKDDFEISKETWNKKLESKPVIVVVNGAVAKLNPNESIDALILELLKTKIVEI